MNTNIGLTAVIVLSVVGISIIGTLVYFKRQRPHRIVKLRFFINRIFEEYGCGEEDCKKYVAEIKKILAHGGVSLSEGGFAGSFEALLIEAKKSVARHQKYGQKQFTFTTDGI